MDRKSGATVRIYQINYLVGFVFGRVDGSGVTTAVGVPVERDTTGSSESDIATSKEMHVSGKQIEGDSV
jgi:hypothetical protein